SAGNAPLEHALDAVAAAELQAEMGSDTAAHQSETSEGEQAVAPPSDTAVEDVANDALDRGPSTVGKDLLEEERMATSEGMPAGEVDEAPKAEAASAGE
ncbi:MAG TPA: hypothetical protein VE545_02320, partial [Candidatus Dormibacteraeota bacterium]|nr:hypothetical protein [Candidatus Dormibacteraeota bacterium]